MKSPDNIEAATSMEKAYGSIDQITSNLYELERSKVVPRKHYKNVGFILALACVVGVLAYMSMGTTGPSSSRSAFSEDTDSEEIFFTLIRSGYSSLPYFETDSSDVVKYVLLDDYLAVIEPYADMEFSLLEGEEDTSESSTYRYAVCEADDSEVCYKGEYSSTNSMKATSVNVPCKPFNEYTISVSEFDDTNTVLRTGSGKGLCIYVRREISGLSTTDLDDTMDAMYTLWSVDEDEGQKLYGDDFHTASYFAAAHDFNAAQQDADHIHEGLGFLPQHIKLTNLFEKAMQAVNPAVTIPYWDFTKDVADNKTIYESSIFTERIFGEITKPVDHYWGFLYSNDNLEDAAIQNGRWSGTRADESTRYPEMGNGFGYMRGPWNMNPSPYVSRFSAYSPNLPSCTDYYGGLGMPDFMTFLQTAPYGSHASTHGVIGSVYGCDKMDYLLEDGLIKDSDSQLNICKKWGFYMKELYRANYISAKDDCTVDALNEKGISCGFDCNDDQYDDMISELKSTISGNYLSSTITTQGWESWRDFICDGDGYRVFVGDHLESASPSDPSFWPIHPTQERLLQVKYMTGSGQTYFWPTDASEDYVCDKSECYVSDYGKKGSFDQCCYGHYEYDQLLDWTTGNASAGYGDTNHQVLLDTNPTNSDYGMSYIYDDFSWDHCDEDFDSLIDSLYSANEPTAKPTNKPTEFTRAPTPSALYNTRSPTAAQMNQLSVASANGMSGPGGSDSGGPADEGPVEGGPSDAGMDGGPPAGISSNWDSANSVERPF